MAIVIVKKKQAKVVLGSATKADEAQIVPKEDLADILGDSEKAIAKFKTAKAYTNIMDKLKVLTDASTEAKAGFLKACEPDLEPDDVLIVSGKRYSVKIGAKGKKREIIDMDDVAEEMGDELFRSLATVTLGNMDKYLNPKQLDKLLKTTQEGARTVKVQK